MPDRMTNRGRLTAGLWPKFLWEESPNPIFFRDLQISATTLLARDPHRFEQSAPVRNSSKNVNNC